MRTNFDKNWAFLPLPVAVIGSYDKTGKPNAMTAAWATVYDFGQVFVSLAQHKTTDNIKASKAFTIAFTTNETVELADYFGIVSGNDEDKFAKAKVEFEKGKVVNAPIIKQFPVVLECELVSLDDGNLVGKIVNTSVDPRYVVNNKVDTSRIDFVVYDMTSHSYRVVGKKVATAFSCGRKFGR